MENISNIRNNLTTLEFNIAQLILKALTNKEIGDTLGRTEKSIKYYITNIYRETEVKNRAQFIVKYRPG